MKTIDLDKGIGVKKILFPDNQPHIVLEEKLEPLEYVNVIAGIRSGLNLTQLIFLANAIEHAGGVINRLTIPYLMGARYDRIINPGDSFDLEVVADVINRLVKPMEVWIFDAHSDVSLKLIGGARSISNRFLVETYNQPDAVLIVPDKGAIPKSKSYPEWNSNLVDIVYCDKSRDLQTGAIKLTVQEPEKCKDRNCIIIDDICDAGGTFLAIANQIEPKHLTLMVSHGIFSKGFRKLKEKFNKIITTDSFWSHHPDDVTTINLRTN